MADANGRRMKLGIGALLLLSGCADSGGTVEPISTRLQGGVYFGAPGQLWTIEAFEVDESGGDTIIDQAVSEDGSFEFELEYRSGTTHLIASTDSQDRLSVFVDASLGTTTEAVLTPVTHLAAILAEREMRDGTVLSDAIARGKALVFEHFAGIAHDIVRPYDVTAEAAVAFTDDVAAGFILKAFETLANGWGDRSSGAVSLGRLLDMLSADLLSDGVLDGLGERGQPLELGGRPLGANVVRAELGRALLEFAGSAENVTAFGPADLQPMAESFATDESALFPEGESEALDNMPPAFRRWWFSYGDTEIPADQPVRGTVDLLVEVADASPVQRISVYGNGVTLDVQGRTMARFELDTQSLGDGPNVVEVVAVDEHGNERRLAVGFEVDNTPPGLTVAEIGRVAGSTVTISGAVDDRRDVEVYARTAGTELGHVGALRGPFSFDVYVVCGRRFILVVEAIDRAGNATEVQKEVLCDATPPAIDILSTNFIQEGSLLAIHDPETGRLDYVPGPSGAETTSIDALTVWPIRVAKFVNRLDDLDELGILGGGPNIPRLRFRAVEVAGQEVASRWATLVVEYRYLVGGIERRGWQQLQPMGGLPEYEVPVAYQWLGPDLAIASASELHEIEVRVIDEAGLSSTRRFGFTIVLLSPPLLLSSCAKSPVLGSFELGLQNVGVLYVTQPESEAVVGALSYPLHLPPGSLAPTLPTRVFLLPPNAVTRVTAFSEDTHQANPNHPDNNRPALNCLSGSHSEVERPSAQYLGCFYGPMPASRALLASAQGLNDLDAHTTRIELRQNGGVVLPDADGRYALSPDSPVDLRTFLIAPRVHFAGVEYDWRTAFTVPSGYQFGPHPVRYRVDASWHEGIERAPYGSFDPPRAYVTRPYLSELEVELGRVSAVAEIDGRPDITVGVQLASACDVPIVHRTVAP